MEFTYLSDEEKQYPAIEKDGKVFCDVMAAKDLVEKKGKRVSFSEDPDWELAVFRIEGELYCVTNICPHRHQPEIYNGILTGTELMCPLHGWTYSLETGQNVNTHQGIKSLKQFEIFEQDGRIYVEKPTSDSTPLWRKNLES